MFNISQESRFVLTATLVLCLAIAVAYFAARWDASRTKGEGPTKPSTAALPSAARAGHVAFMAGIKAEQSKRYRLAARCFHRAAAAGSVRALLHLGDLFAAGHGVEKSYREARIYYARAGAKGSAASYARAASLYRRGLGVPVNLKRAADLYALSLILEKSRISDASTVFHRLEKIKADSVAAPQLRTFFLTAIQRAADNGYPVADFVISLDYSSGILVTRDEPKALRWMHRAAKSRLRRAMLSLGSSDTFGALSPFVSGEAKARDEHRAFYWFRRAARLGSPFAEHVLGSDYAFGRSGVHADRAKALYWLRKAASAGSARAMIDIGKLYALRRTGVADYWKAMRWFKMASAAGRKKSAQRQIALLQELWRTGCFKTSADKRSNAK